MIVTINEPKAECDDHKRPVTMVRIKHDQEPDKYKYFCPVCQSKFSFEIPIEVKGVPE
jgi:hypothetical protein